MRFYKTERKKEKGMKKGHQEKNKEEAKTAIHGGDTNLFQEMAFSENWCTLGIPHTISHL